MKPNTISVFEYDKLRIGDNPLFTKSVHQALESFYSENAQRYFDLIPRGIQFREYVGVIQVNGIQIEILPKLDRNETDESKWQKILIKMLHEVGLFRVSAPSFGSLTLRANSILELYFELFISEVEYLVRTGLIKQYRRHSQNQTSLKGSLDFPRHLAKNLVHKERFYTKTSTYDKDHIWHQILSQTIDLIQSISQNSQIHNRISSLKLSFPEVSPQRITERSFDTLIYTRKSEGYRTAMDIARLLLCNYHPDLLTGRHNVLALMFDMNLLWESFIYHSLRKQNIREGRDYQISAQRSKAFWRSDSSSIALRPDILIEHGDRSFVLDTKWKNPLDNKPTSSDLQQLFAYSQFFRSMRTALVYPAQKDEVQSGLYSIQTEWSEAISCSLIKLKVISDLKVWQKEIYRTVTAWMNAEVERLS